MYRPQLDGLRALAIAVVLASHLWPRSSPAVSHYLPEGYWGVELFFVLSGFLITRLLWIDRATMRRKEGSAASLIATFYARRALRIFPTYYLALAYALVAGLGLTISTLPWFAAYLGNVHIFLTGASGSTNHLWSLAVEEQFYLLWPLVVLLLPSRAIGGVVVTMLVVGPLSRFVYPDPYVEYLLPACLDFLAAGSLLAIVSAEFPPRVEGLLRISAAIGAMLFLLALVLPDDLRTNLQRSGVMCISVFLVGGADRGFSGLAGRMLLTQPVIYVGRISYGLYLYHGFVTEGLLKTCTHFEIEQPTEGVFALLVLVLTFILAGCSWHFIEAPLQILRRGLRRFDANR